MSQKEDLIFIKHMLERIDEVESFSKGILKSEFEKNKLIQNAIIRSIEVLGEAVKNISQSLKNKYPEIKWQEIAGTRDKFIHHYFGVDIDIVWDITKKDIPKLKTKILKIAKDLENR